VRARAEAETLLLHVTGLTRTQLVVSLREGLKPGAAEQLAALVHRRAAGEPLQYLTGQAGFYGRLFRVRPGCLIPRPETEVLAAAAVSWIRAHLPAAQVLDFGCGSGALAITIALECPDAVVTAVDLSEDAAAIAADNAAALQASVAIHVGDGFVWLQHHPIQVLVSNPPYIPTGDLPGLAVEVRGHEPRLALDGGPDGLAYYRRFAALGDGAFLDGPAAWFMEVGFDQAVQVKRLFTEDYAHLWQGWRFSVLDDLRGVPRVVTGERSKSHD
jgi:release factor glutamine methyltransferase